MNDELLYLKDVIAQSISERLSLWRCVRRKRVVASDERMPPIMALGISLLLIDIINVSLRPYNK